MQTSWSQQDNSLMPVEAVGIISKLPVAVYKVMFNPLQGFYLDKLSDSFEFNHKIYGLEHALIERALKTYANTNGNLGILANGLQGAGKTVTLKILANRLGLPIILVETNQGKPMIDFLARLQQDVTLFVDEYEKVFKSGHREDDDESNQDSTLLTLMDGVMKTQYRKVFLLTTNKLWINENMKQRPGRVRYLKEFGNLTKQVIEEIVEDKLNNPALREVTIDFIAKLEIITVDIVTSVVTEVNIHQEDPEVFADLFNVEKLKNRGTIILVNEQDEKKNVELEKNIVLRGKGFDIAEYDSFFGMNVNYGSVMSINENGDYIVQLEKHRFMTHKQLKGKDEAVFRLKTVESYHSSYADRNAF